MLAAISLVLKRGAVLRRAAFHYVGNIYFGAVKAYRRKHLVEQLSSRADERIALYVLVPSGAFAYQHYFGLRIPHAYNHVRAPLAKAAVRAAFKLFV